MASTACKISEMILVAADAEEFLVDSRIANSIKLVNKMRTESLPTADAHKISLGKVNGRALKVIIDWVDHYVKHSGESSNLPEGDNNFSSQDIPEWDRDFIAGWDLSFLIEVLNATSYLGVRGLFDICSEAVVVKYIRGRSVEEIRANFNIQCDFSAEEEEKLKAETQWALED